MKGKQTYLRQSVAAVLIALVATLVASWHQSSSPSAALGFDNPPTEAMPAIELNEFDSSYRQRTFEN